MVLPPACVRLLSRNFSKMHCFRISESTAPEPGEQGGGERASGVGAGPRLRPTVTVPQGREKTAWTEAPPPAQGER